ncbi:MAG: ABC transporter permease [Ignavibacteriales bacterium]|nr:ABC transporter permease [Ignavibacteriales bacterium]
MIEFFVAKRYLRAKHKLNFITIISLLSTLGITIGVAALIIVLSVFNGFGSLVTSIMVSFDPHIRISIKDEKGFSQINSVQEALAKTENISSYSPYVEGKAILLNKKSYEIVNLKGIENKTNDESWGVASKIISGKFDLTEGAYDKIILGIPLALRLSSRIGDTITVTSAYNIEKTITSLSIPQTRRFIVAGIFESENRDYDVSYVFTSVSSAQRLFGLHGKITGYELRLNNFKQAESVKEKLVKKIDTKLFSVNTWYDLHKQLYNVMQIERWAAYILLCLIIAVATFNIFASLTMTVIEKKKDIGVLRAMGVNKNSVLRIFMYEGILVGAIGTSVGIGLGLLVCYLQITYNFYPLDSTKYIIDALPIEIRWTDIFAIGGMAMFLAVVASLYPARRASQTIIIEAIKYE